MGILKIYDLLSSDLINIRDISLAFGVRMAIYQHKQQEKQKAWDIWLVRYSHMNKDNYQSFDKFYAELMPKQKSKASAMEVLKQANEIRNKISSQKKGSE